MSRVPIRQSTVRTLLIAATAAVLSACTSPPIDLVAADDDTLCRHAAGEPGSQSFRQCRDRLERQHRRVMVSNATQIDTLQPNAVALIRPAPDNDITGSVPAPPKTQ